MPWLEPVARVIDPAMSVVISPSAKHAGSYYTPPALVEAVVSWAVREEHERLLDPACGDGRFIATHRNSVGIEQDSAAARAAVERAPCALVHEGDFFRWADETGERFECAAGNPPFIRYQSFKGDVRARALALCARHGVKFSKLASSWAPFLVATAGLLKPGGRMAFVVPAEISYAVYAAPLLEYLVANFARVQVVAVRDKLFPQLSEDCWLLYAEGHGGCADRIDCSVQDRFEWSVRPPRPTASVCLNEWREVWQRRLRPFLLPSAVRDLYRKALGHADSRRLSDFANVNIGYVSGDNDFFHLRPSEIDYWRIPPDFLHPSVRNGRALPAQDITRATIDAWRRSDQPAFLLRLRRGQELPSAVRAYLDSPAGQAAREAYKCRTREPWYAVPDVQVPDFILTYMSGRSATLVRNKAGVTCTNTMHSVRIRDAALAAKLLPAWRSPFLQLSCEVEGHGLGGGMLKLEPREAGRLLFPAEGLVPEPDGKLVEEGIRQMQRWRHYAD